MRVAWFIVAIPVLLLFSCNSDSGEGKLDFSNVRIDTNGLVAYVSYNSECPNCLRSKSSLLEASTSHSDFKWYALFIEDTDTLSLPGEIFTKYNGNDAKAYSKKFGFKVTPEVILMNKGKVIYKGAITDQNKKLTQGKLKANTNYLMQACIAATINSDTTMKWQKAAGCFIEFDI